MTSERDVLREALEALERKSVKADGSEDYWCEECDATSHAHPFPHADVCLIVRPRQALAATDETGEGE